MRLWQWSLAAAPVTLLLLLGRGVVAATPLVCPPGQFAFTVAAGDQCHTLASQLCLDYAYFFVVMNNRELSANCWDDGGRYLNKERCEAACWEGLYPGVQLCLLNHTAELPPGGRCSEDYRCGPEHGHCQYPLCCSAAGFCNSGADWCEVGCQPDYGQCTDPANYTAPVLSCPSNPALIGEAFPNGQHHMIGLAPALTDQVYHLVQPGETCGTLTNDLCIYHGWWFAVMNGSPGSGGCWNATGGDSGYPAIQACEKDSPKPSWRTCWQGLYPGVELCLVNFTARLRPGERCSSYDTSPDSLQCGTANGRHCPYPLCCSAAGWCGIGPGVCEQGCQLDYGMCKHPEHITFTQGLGRCGEPSRTEPGNPAKTALKCPQDPRELPQCCSAFGWCGQVDSYCNGWSACQSEYGWCNTTASDNAIPAGFTYPGGRCGKQTAERLHCLDEQCCSQQGYCGYGPDFCNSDSQPEYGNIVVPSYLAKNLSISYSGGPCGPSAGPNGGLRCQPFACCSEWGICGDAASDVNGWYCGAGCLLQYSAFNGTIGSCDPNKLRQLGTGAANAQMNPPQPRRLLLGALQPADKQRPWHLSPLDISFSNVRTPLICLLLCEQAPDCVVWAFSATNNTCYRSSSTRRASQADSSNTWTSGTRRIAFGTAYLPHTLVVEDGMRYFGAAAEDGNPNPAQFVFSDGRAYRLPQFGAKRRSAQDCEGYCREAPACRVFVYNKRTRQCFRYNNGYFGGQSDANFVSGIVRNGGAADDRLVIVNSSDPQPGCACNDSQAGRDLGFSRLPLTNTAARWLIPLVCQKRNPAVSDPWADAYWADSGQVLACRKGFAGVSSGRACVRGVQRCVDLCLLAKYGGHEGSSCDFYDNALSRYETAFLGKECYWKVMTFGHLGERILCDGKGRGGKGGSGSSRG